MHQYIPVGILLLIALIIVPMTMTIGRFLRPRRPSLTKMQPYECGIEVNDPPRGRMSVHFYLVAVVFLVFDVETIFLFPWAVMYRKLALFGLVEMVVFLLILLAGYVYVWRRGALSWA